MKEIGRDIEADDTQLRYAGGYDHNYALDKADGTMQLAARARGAKSGICMDVYTDPALYRQLYHAADRQGRRAVRQAPCILSGDAVFPECGE